MKPLYLLLPVLTWIQIGYAQQTDLLAAVARLPKCAVRSHLSITVCAILTYFAAIVLDDSIGSLALQDFRPRMSLCQC